MSGQADLESLEREAYRASWSDGIVDIYVGLSMIWLGAMWIWENDLSAMAGLVPAIFVAPMLSVRKRFVEARLGYVRWGAPRRDWERRNLWMLLATGLGLLLMGVAGYLLASSDDSPGSLRLAPGILAWLLALLGIGLALVMDARRMLLYAALLAVGGGVVVMLEAMPGWPMLVTGMVATVAGGAMLWRFVRRHPVMDQP